jgi:hypothetical protein
MEKKLLELFSDLYSYDDNISSWSLDSFEEKTPRYYRLQMIDSLMKALEINCNYIQFSQGDFISNKQLERWADFKKSIGINLPQDEANRGSLFPTSTFDINNIFRILMRYRLYAHKLLLCNDNIYAASGEFRTFVNLTNTPNLHLIQELKKIDAVLLFCINPTGISYTQEELISQFGFPDVNLREVDLDWM